jgi:amino acid adenylation domain-containing protein
MNTGEFIACLQDLGVRLSAKGERLHVSAPKNKLPTDLRAQIAERKADILALLRQRSLTKRIAAPPIKPRASSEPAPLSFAQERLWFLEQLEPQSVAYNICRASRLFGNLNTSALEASLNEIISRHETLRTAFRLVDGRPVQFVQPARNISIKIADLRSMATEERDSEIQRRIKAEVERPFDLSAGQLLRCTLLRVSDQEHVLILMTHHSASDAWSMGILTRELWTLYEAFSNGKPSPLAFLPVQYSDYAVWQRNWFQSEVLDAQLAYWKKQLENFSILNLPTDGTRPPRQSSKGARFSITLPQKLTASLNELSNRIAVTPFMTLLTAFQVLLYRYTGQEDIVVGSPVANRRRPEIEGLIGFFVNTLVLRADLSGNPSFRELLVRVKDTCVAADANQDLPFEKLVQELQPERDLSRNPLFQVMFVLQNATRPFSGIAGLRVEPIEIETTRSPFDLSLFLREREGKYIGYIEYSTDLFDRDRIERMASHFQTLLEAIVSDPDQSIATLPILAEAERHQILVEWNDTAADYPKDKCIHQLFEAQVELTPDAIALEFEDKQITYRELNCKANQLAHYLISLGIGPEKLVGICVERSIEMVIGLLGILKAGGTYIPLDPAYPKERLRFMLEDANISVLVTQENLLDRTKDSTLSTQCVDVCLDRDAPVIEKQHPENPNSWIAPDKPAYVIYTSGSTGAPKGVIGTHSGAVNRFNWMWQKFPFEPNEKCCVNTSLSFVDSIWELFGPMLKGVSTTLIPNAVVRDTPRFVQRLAQQRITRLVLVPSLLQSFLDTVSGIHSLLPDLKIWSSSGESLSKEFADRFRTSLPGRTLLNLYGSSEVAADVTFYDCCDRDQGANMGVGRPISNTQIYILDSGLQPLPTGVPGELYVGGAGLARGYLNRTELTNERFIQNPFNRDRNSRLYKTGDLARYRPDGNIEFLGRVDNQVKIRGFRIELGEIEATLDLHPAVKESLVVAHERQAASERELVGYVVLDKASAPDINGVRAYLVTKLPAFMIPSVLVKLDALPQTPNGKIDRSKLPSPEESPRDLNAVPIPPRSELEELVANIWRHVLQIENVSVHDNFFALGGHSLLAIQIVSRLQKALNKEVPLRILFDAPTIAELGQELETIIRDGHAPELPPIVRAPRDGPLPLSMNQEHLWYLDKALPGTHFFNMPYVYRLSGELNVEALEMALSEIIRRHEALRTVFAEIDGRPVQIIKDGSTFHLPTEDLRGGTPDDLSQQAAVLLLEERGQPFDLATGPLFESKLLRLTDRESFMLVTMHHIISDQWSMQVFYREMVSIYEAYSQGRHSPFGGLPFQFGDHAVWEKRLLKSGLLDRQQEYWKQQLAGPLPELEFMKSPTRNKELSFRSSRQPIELDETLFRGIKALARRESCTPFMIILAALDLALYALTGQEDIRIGTLVANRRRREAESAIGHLLNTVVLRIKLSPSLSCGQLLRQVREITLAGYAHQELPFEHLARVLETEIRIKRGSLFQVLLSYHNSGFQPINLPGLTFASLGWQLPVSDSEVTLTACDLIVNITETSTKLTGSVNYKTDSVDIDFVASMVEGFATVLRQMTVETGQVVSGICIEIGKK